MIVLLAGGTGGGTMSHKGRVHKLGGEGQLLWRGWLRLDGWGQAGRGSLWREVDRDMKML
jgi:hypothetical protein